MTASRRSALVVLAVGGALALATQLAVPVGLPLYDGVVVSEPYRFLAPGSGQAGSPTSFSSEPGLQGGASRAFDAATTENPPQAQLIALPGAFVVPAGVATVKVSIAPVAPIATPTAGSIAGNVYRFSVTDGSGAQLAIAAGQAPTLTLRAPDGVADAAIGRLTPTGWQILPTDHGGAYLLFSTNPTELGDFAAIAGAGGGVAPGTVVIAVAIALLGVLIAIVVVLLVRRRQEARRLEEASRPATRTSSRRRRRR